MTAAYNRFDHEQQLLDCWRITSDLQTILEATESAGMTSAATDEIQNMLIGTIALYERKFDKLFQTFEQSIKTGVAAK